MNKKFSKKRVIIALVLIFIFIGSTIFGFFIYGRTFGESVYCQSLRSQKDIDISYSCESGKEYSKNGITYVNLSVNRPNKFVDNGIFTMEKNTKKISNEMWAD